MSFFTLWLHLLFLIFLQTTCSLSVWSPSREPQNSVWMLVDYSVDLLHFLSLVSYWFLTASLLTLRSNVSSMMALLVSLSFQTFRSNHGSSKSICPKRWKPLRASFDWLFARSLAVVSLSASKRSSASRSGTGRGRRAIAVRKRLAWTGWAAPRKVWITNAWLACCAKLAYFCLRSCGGKTWGVRSDWSRRWPWRSLPFQRMTGASGRIGVLDISRNSRKREAKASHRLGSRFVGHDSGSQSSSILLYGSLRQPTTLSERRKLDRRGPSGLIRDQRCPWQNRGTALPWTLHNVLTVTKCAICQTI